MRGNGPPVVLHPVSLPDFLRYILDNHAPPTNLIVCSSRDAFLHELLRSVRASHDHRQTPASDDRVAVQSDAERGARNPAADLARLHPLLIPTIHLVATSQTVRVAFCPDPPALQAHLAVHGIRPADPAAALPDTSPAARPLLALLNPLALHRDTSSFSAQGLGRTLASAVEAALRAGQKLVVAECPPSGGDGAGAAHDEDGADDEGLGGNSMDVETSQDAGPEDPWEQQIAILNVTTRSFGVGERGWVGRTVRAKRVVERWCRFEKFVGADGGTPGVNMGENAG